jgi:hypothetical protein
VADDPLVRKGQGEVKLSREEFERRLRERFYDPPFNSIGDAVDRVVDVAWDAYREYRKSPRTRKAGPGFADPDYELPIEWLDARERILDAARTHQDAATPPRILLVAGAARHDQTCPGEMSKTFRLAEMARDEIERAGTTCDFLDLSLLTAQYGRQILPCKACVSTAMPLCHWPCSCYPNHAMGQVNDWMNELYPRWVAAHGVMIVTPVYWYQAPSVLKLMIDRLVCADGGNPDPTTTRGKTPEIAKRIELDGWDFSPPPRWPCLLRHRAWRCRGSRDAAPIARRLAHRHGTAAGESRRHLRSLHRLLRAVRHQPRRARSRHGRAAGDAQRGEDAGRGRGSAAIGEVPPSGRGAANAAAQVAYGVVNPTIRTDSD